MRSSRSREGRSLWPHDRGTGGSETKPSPPVRTHRAPLPLFLSESVGCGKIACIISSSTVSRFTAAASAPTILAPNNSRAFVWGSSPPSRDLGRAIALLRMAASAERDLALSVGWAFDRPAIFFDAPHPDARHCVKASEGRRDRARIHVDAIGPAVAVDDDAAAVGPRATPRKAKFSILSERTKLASR